MNYNLFGMTNYVALLSWVDLWVHAMLSCSLAAHWVLHQSYGEHYLVFVAFECNTNYVINET